MWWGFMSSPRVGSRYRPEPIDMRGVSSRQWTVWDSVTGQRLAYVAHPDAEGRAEAVRICTALNVMEVIEQQQQQEKYKKP